ncbi:MAG: 6-hydroxymethylpterin diphosphokinase MptE-like protein [Nitrososphaerales archaeon]
MEQWQHWYRKITERLGYDSAEDGRAAEILSRLLKDRQMPLEELRRRVEGRPALIFGAGPSLEADLKRIARKTRLLESCSLITADGATTALLKTAHKNPDIVVTDLDGVIEDIQAADRNGAYVVIHAHGDNIPQLRRYVGGLSNVLGTTQVEPTGGLHNFGGFTDGDRAVFLAEALGGGPLALAGMDLGEVAGRFSKISVASPEVKAVKLRFCKDLLEWLASNAKIDLYNLTGGGEEIEGFRRVSPEEFEEGIITRW